MIAITIQITEMDYEEINRIGNLPWHKATDDDKQKYDRLIALCGTAVCLKVVKEYWR